MKLAAHRRTVEKKSCFKEEDIKNLYQEEARRRPSTGNKKPRHE